MKSPVYSEKAEWVRSIAPKTPALVEPWRSRSCPATRLWMLTASAASCKKLALSALNHPNIVTLHDIASDGDADYLVMEYVSGKSLEKLITPKGLPLSEAIGYAIQIAGALAAAHAAGIVHRDIKPANVIVTAESQIKVLDFGLAKLMEQGDDEGETLTQESALTEAGTVIGTVAYMSPEQAGARPLDHRTDIFSLGVVLYEMISGQKPFRGKSAVETMHAITNDPAPPFANHPPALKDILDKALAKDPKDRYYHAGDFSLDLRRFLTRPAEAARSQASRTLPLKWAAAAAAVMVVLIFAATWMWRTAADVPDNPLTNAQFTRFTDFEGSESDAALSRDGRFIVFRSDRDGPIDTWVSQVGSGRFVNLTKGTRSSVLVRNAGFTADGSEIWLSAILGGDRMRLIPSMGGPTRPFLSEHAMEAAWSPDGLKIVFHPYDTGDPMFVTDSSGSNSQQIFKLGPGGHNHFPVWSRDGQWIYFVSGLWDAREMDIWRILAVRRKSGALDETRQRYPLSGPNRQSNYSLRVTGPERCGPVAMGSRHGTEAEPPDQFRSRSLFIRGCQRREASPCSHCLQPDS